jgi:DNA-binding NarL/FixJ family response regulator
VFLPDDHEIVRRGIRDLLEAEGDIVVVGEASTADQAVGRVHALDPDVALLDVRLEDGNGIEACRDIRSLHPRTACLILTSFADDEALFHAIMAGAAGYVLKQIRSSELVDAVRRVAAGQSLLDPDGHFLIDKVRATVAGRLRLVPRFRQVLSSPRLGLGTPLWIDAPAFDLSDHVRVRQLPARADESELLRTVEQLVARRLDRSRPLWEMWLLPGLPENRIGLLIKVHHALADGIGGLATIGALLDATPESRAEPARAWTPASPPLAVDLFADNLRRHLNGLRRTFAILIRPVITLRKVRSVWPAMRELKESGKVGKLGVSIHDRVMARKLVDELALDLLMIRYNAAHRGAEREIFATLPEGGPAIVSYTATRWGRLLKAAGDLGPMSAPECYRFQLGHPRVTVALCDGQSRGVTYQP